MADEQMKNQSVKGNEMDETEEAGDKSMVSQAPKVPMVFLCTYCGQKPKLVSGKVIYPHRPDLYGKRFWNCEPCGAYVGCHPGTDNPLGRLANATLRTVKQKAHAAFDPLWKSKEMKRKDAYYWLSKQLGIPYKDAHIGHFDVELCKATVRACANLSNEESNRTVGQSESPAT